MKKRLATIPAVLVVLLAACGVVEKLGNRAPVIGRMYATDYEISPGDTTTIIVEATDPDDDLLSYTWDCSGGSFVSTQEPARREWRAPTNPGSYRISVAVRDENGAETGDAVSIVVRSEEPPRVEIIHPVEGEFIPGIGFYTVDVRATHQTNEVDSVEFLVDGVLEYTDSLPVSDIFSFDWNVAIQSGRRTVTAKGYGSNSSGEPGVDSVHVIVEGVTPFPSR